MHVAGLGVVEVFLIATIGIILLLGIVLLVALGSWVARRANETDSPHEDPQKVLKRRLAAGEIDEETYDRLRQRISEE